MIIDCCRAAVKALCLLIQCWRQCFTLIKSQPGNLWMEIWLKRSGNHNRMRKGQYVFNDCVKAGRLYKLNIFPWVEFIVMRPLVFRWASNTSKHGMIADTPVNLCAFFLLQVLSTLPLIQIYKQRYYLNMKSDSTLLFVLVSNYLPSACNCFG